MNEIKLWYYRWFCVIPKTKAEKLGLKPLKFIYGDRINQPGYKSIWIDSKYRGYQVETF